LCDVRRAYLIFLDVLANRLLDVQQHLRLAAVQTVASVIGAYPAQVTRQLVEAVAGRMHDTDVCSYCNIVSTCDDVHVANVALPGSLRS
jgi:hypothetical protein